MTIIPVRPIPYADETAASLLIRATELNGHCTIQNLTNKKITRNAIATLYGNRRYYQGILKELGITGSSLELAFDSKGYTSKSPLIYENVIIERSIFHYDLNTYCSECLREEPYWHQRWLLKPYYGCIKHKRLLTHGCNQCGCPLSAARGSITQCPKCDTDLRDVLSSHTDVSALYSLQEIINDKNQYALNTVFNFFDRYNHCAAENKSNSTSKKSLEFAIYFLHEDTHLANYIAEQTVANHPLIHPRLKLLSFLTSNDKNLYELAHKVIDLIPSKAYSERDFNSALLNKRQACAFLKMSSAQLEAMIKKRKISWLSPLENNGKINAYELIDHLAEEECALSTPAHKSVTRNNSEWLSVLDIAERLNVHPEIIRSLIKNNWLIVESMIIDGHRKMVASVENLDEFQKNYVLVGTLARELNVNATNLMEKLKKLGIYAIAGKGIDRLITSLFKRELVSSLTTKVVENISTYETKAGRPPAGTPRETVNHHIPHSLPFVASELEISIQKVLKLIKKGFLKIASGKNHYPILIEENSLTSLVSQLRREDLVPIAEAAKQLGVSENILIINWVSSGVVRIEDFIFWRFITINDLRKIEYIKKEYLSSSEASDFFGMHRSHIPNLEKRGLISSLKLHGKRTIRLYKISQLQELKDNISY